MKKARFRHGRSSTLRSHQLEPRKANMMTPRYLPRFGGMFLRDFGSQGDQVAKGRPVLGSPCCRPVAVICVMRSALPSDWWTLTRSPSGALLLFFGVPL